MARSPASLGGEVVLEVDVPELVDRSHLAQYAASLMGVGEEGGQIPGGPGGPPGGGA